MVADLGELTVDRAESGCKLLRVSLCERWDVVGHVSGIIIFVCLDLIKAFLKSESKGGELRDYDVVFKHTLQELVLSNHSIELIKFDAVFRALLFELFHDIAQLLMSLDASHNDVVQQLLFKKVTSVFAIQCLESFGGPRPV